MSANVAKVDIPNSTALDPRRPLPSNKAQLKLAPTKAFLQVPNNDNDHFKICTPVLVDQLSINLKGYDPKTKLFLTKGFTSGFRIPYEGPREFRYSNNLSSLKGQE